MASMGEAVIKGRIELDNAIVVRPGDKLVVGLHRRLDMATAFTIRRNLSERLPGVEIQLIDDCSGLAVYRDEPTGIIKLSQTLTEDEVQALRERGVIDGEGKSTGDKIAEYFERNA